MQLTTEQRVFVERNTQKHLQHDISLNLNKEYSGS